MKFYKNSTKPSRNQPIKHKRNLLLTAISLSLAAGLAENNALAQEQREATVFAEVTVTATKREQSNYEVPVAVSAFTAATIEKQGIFD